VNFHSFRNALGGILLALTGVFLLNSCGGGGAAATTQGSVMRILPEGPTTVYGGVPATWTVVGGRFPYTLGSSEPSILPVPQTLNGNTITIIPANPGVVDTGIPAGALPVRSATISARDATGLFAQAQVRVGVNFLTGYGLALTPTNCPAGAGTASTTITSACAGGTTAVQMNTVFGGGLYGDQQFRLEVIRGNFSLRHPVTGQVGSSITVNSDHTGTLLGLIEAAPNVGTQVAVIRVVHVPTGVYADQVFIIEGTPLALPDATMVAIPDSFTFTGATTAECGTGFGDFYVFGGTPPFHAVSTNPTVLVTPTDTNTNPGRFTVAASNPTICVDNATVIVTDSQGRRETVSVTTATGSGTPPAPVPITVSPASLTLTCGTGGSISVIGGVGPLSVNSSHPRVTALLSGNTITITRQAGDGATVYPTTATISVTDGSSITPATVTVPANCP
jgi:hypothetical protein